jgi:hypothetical protein
LKEEALECTVWKTCFGRYYRPVIRQCGGGGGGGGGGCSYICGDGGGGGCSCGGGMGMLSWTPPFFEPYLAMYVTFLQLAVLASLINILNKQSVIVGYLSRIITSVYQYISMLR